MTTKEARNSMLQGLLYTFVFTLLLFAIPLVNPWLALFFILLLPAVPALQATKQNFPYVIFYAVLGIATIGMFSQALMLTAMCLYCIGLGLGWGFKNQIISSSSGEEVKPPHTADQILVPAFCGAIVGTLLLMLLMPVFTGSSLLENLESVFLTTSEAITEIPGVDMEIATQTQGYILQLLDNLRANLVYALCSLALFVTIVSYTLTRFVLVRLKTALPTLPAFSLWELPSRIIFILLLTLLPVMFSAENTSWPLVFCDSLNQLLLLLCAILGLAVVDFFLQQWRFPLFLRVALRPVIFFAPTMQSILLLIGMLDIGLDVRKLRRIVA